jgi:hypothetical protein
MTGREQLNRLKSGHTPLVQALFDEAYACGHKDGRADGEAVIGMLEAARSELAAAQAELEELHAATGPYLILDEREGIIGIVEATDPDDAWAKFQAANPGDYDGDPDDNEVLVEGVTLEWCDKVVDALEIARSELAAYRKAAGL